MKLTFIVMMMMMMIKMHSGYHSVKANRELLHLKEGYLHICKMKENVSNKTCTLSVAFNLFSKEKTSKCHI